MRSMAKRKKSMTVKETQAHYRAENIELSLAAMVKRNRKELGLTQFRAAMLAGCQRQFVSEVERGKMSLRLDKLLDLLRVLGLKLTIEFGSGELQARSTFE